MKFLGNAPRTLIQLFERGPQIDDNRPPHLPDSRQSLLKKLLCDKRMERAWNIVQKSVKSDRGYTKLWMNIVSAKLHAGRGTVSQALVRDTYNDIAKAAQNLSSMIAEPQRLPPDGTARPYDGDLDLQAYEFLPEDVAKLLGAQSWATMTSDQRSEWAYALLLAWPTMVELLDQLAIRARQCGSEKVPVVQRDRGRAKPAIFIREVYNSFVSLNPRFTGFAAIAAITSIAMDTKITSKTVRTVIFGSSGTELPIKRRRKLATNE